MIIAPSSTITIYKDVPIDNGEQMVFTSLAHQAAYFLTKAVTGGVQYPCTMVRKTGAIRIAPNQNLTAAVISKCNYISFTNPNFDNKTFYARIVDYEYVNNECIDISYAIDIWQSWMFDVDFEDMYIDREHLGEIDWTKAEANPYDPTIFEFQTGEDLPINQELEKPYYDICQYYDIGEDMMTHYDGYPISFAIQDTYGASNQIVGTLIKLSSIDFYDLDAAWEETPQAQRPAYRPSERYADWLCTYIGYDTQNQNPTDGVNGKWGFYILDEWTRSKLASLSGYTTRFTDREFLGTGWSDIDSDFSPSNSSDFDHGCSVLFIAQSRLSTSSDNGLGIFLNMLTEWDCLSAIVDMVCLTQAMAVSSGCTPMTSSDTDVMKAPQKTAASLLSSSSTLVNKKLLLYPFSYLRLIAPNGDIKELRYEWFKDAQDGDDEVQVGVMLDMSDKLDWMIVPYKYRWHGVGNHLKDFNTLEALHYYQFPTKAYTIDSYLAQVANATMDVIRSRTIETAYNMAAEGVAVDKTTEMIHMAQIGAGIAQNVAGEMGGSETTKYNANGTIDVTKSQQGMSGTGIVNSAALALSQREYGANLEARRGTYAQKAMEWNSVAKTLSGDIGANNQIANNLALTRSAYACNKYTPSNGVGSVNYNTLAFNDIIFMRVSLNSVVMERFDKFFTMFGYKSGRCGIPRVINYIKGSGDTPHWLTLNGKDTTYVKTMDCKVIHSMIPVSNAIREMFNNGVRFIKGDLSNG